MLNSDSPIRKVQLTFLFSCRNFVKFLGITVVLQGHRKKVSVWSLNASWHPKCAFVCSLGGFNCKHWLRFFHRNFNRAFPVAPAGQGKYPRRLTRSQLQAPRTQCTVQATESLKHIETWHRRNKQSCVNDCQSLVSMIVQYNSFWHYTWCWSCMPWTN